MRVVQLKVLGGAGSPQLVELDIGYTPVGRDGMAGRYGLPDPQALLVVGWASIDCAEVVAVVKDDPAGLPVGAERADFQISAAAERVTGSRRRMASLRATASALARLLLLAVTRLFWMISLYAGTAMASRMVATTIVTNSSISVKPSSFFMSLTVFTFEMKVFSSMPGF